MGSGTVLAVLSLIVAIVSMLGGPLAAYVAVRVGIATVSTKLDDIARRLDRIESTRDADGTRISSLEAKDAAKEARIVALERTVRTMLSHLTAPDPPSEDERG